LDGGREHRAAAGPPGGRAVDETAGAGSWWGPEEALNPWALDGWEPSRPRSIRVIGLIAAASLLLATIGTTIGVLVGDSPGAPSLPLRVLSVLPSPTTAAGRASGPTESVRFSVANPGRNGLEAACQVVLEGHRGSAVGVVGLAAGATDQVSVEVPVAPGPFVGSPADARVRCAALSSATPDTN
jgi:hypothetical protein